MARGCGVQYTRRGSVQRDSLRAVALKFSLALCGGPALPPLACTQSNPCKKCMGLFVTAEQVLLESLQGRGRLAGATLFSRRF